MAESRSLTGTPVDPSLIESLREMVEQLDHRLGNRLDHMEQRVGGRLD